MGRSGEKSSLSSHASDISPYVERDDIHISCPSHTTEQKLMQKVDRRVIPILCILYFLTFLDRTNIGNAVVFDLEPDLGLDPKSNQFNTALTIFFVPYVLLEVPSNILLKRVRPHIWLSGSMFAFGFITICQGLVQNYSGLLATRFFLGIAQAGLFPGCFYLIGMWYKRSEALKRYTYFFNSTTLAGAFGGLLASAIGKMNGMRGYLAWRWIFILEGTLACAVAVGAYFVITDFPEQAKWLTEDERAYVKARLAADQGESEAERKIAFSDILDVLKDFKIWIGSLMYFSFLVPAYSYAYFSPTIIESYNYSPIQTQLHSVPPLAVAFFLSLAIAYSSDRLQHRYLFVLVPVLLAISGLAILTTVHNNTHLEYGALFLVALGPYCGMPVALCWFTMNLGGHRRRAIGTAFQLGFGEIGGIVATYAFVAREAPIYRTGYSLAISFFTLAAVMASLYGAACWWQNRSRDRLGSGMDAHREAGEMVQKRGDLDPEYRYML